MAGALKNVNHLCCPTASVSSYGYFNDLRLEPFTATCTILVTLVNFVAGHKDW